ncbi:uncharacterized protein [Ranitomeya imitator]|uniref:uncharacterized protein n=1 Tax=Ranitomeya imitator TaxID=111125 RepID=UPI0037E88202
MTKRKVKLFYYLIGENGRELAHTLLPDTDNLHLADIVQAFDKHCDPKKNETVERYKFFTRHQEDGENVDRYLTELRRLAETCGFGEIRDSLIKDRMVCGIKDSHLKERLLREEGMTLEKCMQICRAAELTKHSLKMMAGTSENDDDKVHAVSMKGKTGPDYPINTVHCKYCGKRHERDKTKCPAYGETCRSCGKKNHSSVVCRQGRGKQYRQLHTVTPDTDSAEDITWLQMQSTTEKVNVVGQSVVKDAKQLYAPFLLDEKPIRFQLDCGASCNVISFDLLNKQVSIEPTDKVLVMYNKSVLKPMGTCKLKIRNPCNRKSYRVEFTVLRGGNQVPLLGVKAVQAMDLIKVQSQNIMSVEVAQDIQNPKLNAEHNLDMQKIKAEYADVFEGDGCFEGKYRLEIDNTVQYITRAGRISKKPAHLKDYI